MIAEFYYMVGNGKIDGLTYQPEERAGNGEICQMRGFRTKDGLLPIRINDDERMAMSPKDSVYLCDFLRDWMSSRQWTYELTPDRITVRCRKYQASDTFFGGPRLNWHLRAACFILKNEERHGSRS